MGAHVWLPAFIRSHLFPAFDINGWSMDWYAGFPPLTFFFPLPMVAIALASFVIPYDIAFKLVSASGLILLPLAAWAFGRLSKMPFPGPACLSVAAVAFLFNRDFTIYGGNIASAMAGEFNFSVSLVFALLFLGLTAKGLKDGRSRFAAALLLFCAALSHVLPLFFAILGATVLFLMKPDRHRARWLVPVFAVSGLMSAFWSLPFEYRLPYATNMGYQKITTYISSLFPAHYIWLLVLAAAGAAISLARRRRMGIWMTIMAAVMALLFRVGPDPRLWNARWLPFWFLMLYFLAGLAFAEIGTLLVESFSARARTVRRGLVPVPVLTLLVGLIWVGYPLHILPFGHQNGSTYDWLGITSTDSSFVPDWVHWNYSGYQSSGKTRRNEYFALMRKMAALGANPADGCGRAMYEYQPELNNMGTPDALMLLPYWTHNCIDSMEGLYYESSATTPYHFLNAAELSKQPSNPVRGLNYPSGPNVAEGIRHLQMFGVKYYMAISPSIEAKANADPSLKLVAKVGPYPVAYTLSNGGTQVRQRTWDIYRILHSATVSPLANQPVVMRGVSAGGSKWLKASEAWYLDPARWGVYEAASGPKSWARVSATDTRPPRTPLPAVKVSGIRQTQETISFNVDRTGVPVLVKTSYFPNWQVSGGKGVWRVTPNLMVVIPTSRHVRLYYGSTPVNWIGWLLSAVGLAGLVVLWRRKQVVYPTPRHLLGSGGSARQDSLTSAMLAEPYRRLEEELADAHPGGLSTDGGAIDLWLGQPAGLDLARYGANGWSVASDPVGPDPVASDPVASDPVGPDRVASSEVPEGPHQPPATDPGTG